MEGNGKQFPIKYGEHKKVANFVELYLLTNMKYKINGSIKINFQDGKIMNVERLEVHR